jgi:adenylate cyclase
MKRLALLFSFLVIFALNTAFSQTKINLDSLSNFCDNYTTNDTVKLKALIKVSEGYQSKNQLKGIAFGEKAVELATQLNNQNLLANAYHATGKNLMRNSRYPDALVLFEKALEIQKNANNQAALGRLYNDLVMLYRRKGDVPNALKMYDLCMPLLQQTKQEKEIALAYNNVATVYMSTSDYPLSMNFLQKAIIINEKLGEVEPLAVNLNNMGYIQVLLSDYNGALLNLNRALEINQKLENKMWIAMHSDNIGMAYYGLKEYDKSLEILHKALAINEEIGNKTSVSINLNNIGKAYLALGNYPEATTSLFRSLDMSSKANDRHTQGWAYCHLGSAYSQSTVPLKDGANHSQRLQKAIQYYQGALETSAITKTVEIQSASWQGLGKVYKEQGLYQKAYDAFEKHITLKDSIGGANIKKQIARKEIEYEFNKKEVALEQEKQLNEQNLFKRNIFIIFLAILFAALVYFYYNSKNQRLVQEQNALLEVKVTERTAELQLEKEKSETLLLNILPEAIANELKLTGKAIPRRHENVSVMFIDIKGFTQFSENVSPEDLVEDIDYLFRGFDKIIARNKVEKIKTIGDAYLCASGLPNGDPKHAQQVLQAAVEMLRFVEETKAERSFFDIRIGIHSGPVVAGVVGDSKFAYDIWGDTVNMAARMEQNSEAGKINISEDTYVLVKDWGDYKHRGKINAKNKGEIDMYFVV